MERFCKVDKDYSVPLDYIPRIKNYYVGLGYEQPYEWAALDDMPLTRLQKKLVDAKIGIGTTAALFAPANGDQGPCAPYNGKAKFFTSYAEPVSPFPDVRISHIAIDRAHTNASDMASYFPLAACFGLPRQDILARFQRIFMDCQQIGHKVSPFKQTAQNYYRFAGWMLLMLL